MAVISGEWSFAWCLSLAVDGDDEVSDDAEQDHGAERDCEDVDRPELLEVSGVHGPFGVASVVSLELLLGHVGVGEEVGDVLECAVDEAHGDSFWLGMVFACELLYIMGTVTAMSEHACFDGSEAMSSGSLVGVVVEAADDASVVVIGGEQVSLGGRFRAFVAADGHLLTHECGHLYTVSLYCFSLGGFGAGESFLQVGDE